MKHFPKPPPNNPPQSRAPLFFFFGAASMPTVLVSPPPPLFFLLPDRMLQRLFFFFSDFDRKNRLSPPLLGWSHRCLYPLSFFFPRALSNRKISFFSACRHWYRAARFDDGVALLSFFLAARRTFARCVSHPEKVALVTARPIFSLSSEVKRTVSFFLLLCSKIRTSSP